jgi:hypothetical protein
MNLSQIEHPFTSGRRASACDSIDSDPRFLATEDRTERTTQSLRRLTTARRHRPNEAARARIQEGLCSRPTVTEEQRNRGTAERRGRDGGRRTLGGDWSTSERREQDSPFRQCRHSSTAREAGSPSSHQEETFGLRSWGAHFRSKRGRNASLAEQVQSRWRT